MVDLGGWWGRLGQELHLALREGGRSPNTTTTVGLRRVLDKLNGVIFRLRLAAVLVDKNFSRRFDRGLGVNIEYGSFL